MTIQPCPQCGQENQPGDKFCVKCGTPLNVENTAKVTAPANDISLPDGCAWCGQRSGTGLVEYKLPLPAAKRIFTFHLERCPECEQFAKKIKPFETIAGWVVFLLFFVAFYGMVAAMQQKNWLLGILSFAYILYTMAEAMLWKRNYLRQWIVKGVLALGAEKTRPSGYTFNQTGAFFVDAYGFLQFLNPDYHAKFAGLNPGLVNPRTKK